MFSFSQIIQIKSKQKNSCQSFKFTFLGLRHNMKLHITRKLNFEVYSLVLSETLFFLHYFWKMTEYFISALAVNSNAIICGLCNSYATSLCCWQVLTVQCSTHKWAMSFLNSSLSFQFKACCFIVWKIQSIFVVQPPWWASFICFMKYSRASCSLLSSASVFRMYAISSKDCNSGIPEPSIMEKRFMKRLACCRIAK